MSDERDVDQKRRGFLRLASLAAPAAALGTASGAPAAVAEAAPQGTGLRKTEHVKKYLETARF
jgi:hypothetical protein